MKVLYVKSKKPVAHKPLVDLTGVDPEKIKSVVHKTFSDSQKMFLHAIDNPPSWVKGELAKQGLSLKEVQDTAHNLFNPKGKGK